MNPRSSPLLMSFVCGLLAGCFPDPKLLDDLDDLRSEVVVPPSDVSDGEVDTLSGDATEGDIAAPECTRPTDCPAPPNQCQEATCVDNKCGFKDVEGSCDDLDACTTNDKCAAGACLGTPNTCDTPGACHRAGSCEPTTGECVYPLETNGTACDDGDRCTGGDACLDGECKPTREKDDTNSDWAQLLPATANASAQLAGLKTMADGFVALVNFQRVGEGEARIGSMGQSSGLQLSESASEGVALFKFSFRGELLRAELVATSPDQVRGSGLSVLDNNRLMIAGKMSGTATMGSNLTLTSKPDSTAYFGLRFDNFQLSPSYWLLEADTQGSGDGLHGVFGAGTDCVAVAHIQAGRTAFLSNEDGLVTQIDAPESAFSAFWMVWLPGCGSIGGAERLVTTSGDGGVLVLALERDSEGGTSIGGYTSNGLVLHTPNAPSEVVFPGAGSRGFALRLDRERQPKERIVVNHDVFETYTFIRALVYNAGGLWASFDVGYQAYFGVDEDSMTPVPGNPIAVDDYQGRVVVTEIRMEGLGPTNILGLTDYEGKESSAVGRIVVTPSGRLVVAPTFDIRSAVDDPPQAMLTLRSIVDGATLWNAGIFDSDTGSPLSVVGPILIDNMPLGEGVLAGGTVSGKGRVGPPSRTRTAFETPEGVDAVYFSRFNSDDGLGCGR